MPTKSKEPKTKTDQLESQVEIQEQYNAFIQMERNLYWPTMTRSKLKCTCLLVEFERRSVRNALENESQIEAMNEEIEQIEKNKTWTLVPRL